MLMLFSLIFLLSSLSIYPNSNNLSPLTNKFSSTAKYPLIKDVVHPDKPLFFEIAKRLKAGKFEKVFRRGMLFYGPPGVGKDEMIKAIVNESECLIFTRDGSQLVSGLQGSGAQAIASIFNKARKVDPSKGVVVLIDELQGITPVTSDKNIKPAFKNDGLEHENSLTQLWLEFDKCSKEEHANIMIIATCNQFDRIDKCIRDRFMCIEFSNPNDKDAYEILKNKAQYYNVPLTEAELKKYIKNMKGLSGRDLTTFIQDTGVNISKGLSKEKALESAAKRRNSI
jgi:AAA+ superfamily predicted ATPase